MSMPLFEEFQGNLRGQKISLTFSSGSAHNKVQRQSPAGNPEITQLLPTAKEETKTALENVQKFMKKFAANKSLQEQLKEKKAEEVVALAAEMGFDFTKEEPADFAKSIEELSPDQPDRAAGGDAADFEQVMQSITGGITKGIEKTVDGACWVADKGASAYNFVTGVISSRFN